MKEANRSNNILLSYALFRKIYDDGQNIYDIISIFISHELSSDMGIYEFSVNEMTNKINDRYKFDIPDAIVKKALRILIKSKNLIIDNKIYTLSKKFKPVEEIGNVNSDSMDYILKIMVSNIKNVSKDNIEQALESYFLNKRDEFNIFNNINSCITKYQKDKRFIDSLNEIKEGFVLYTSLTDGADEINIDHWKQKTIFLDTEILFFLSSYAGELRSKTSNVFLDIIKKIINKKAYIVKLRFFYDTKDEIDGFFDIAENILRKKISRKPNSIISYILTKCQTASDIIRMKKDFYDTLSKNSINLYKKNIDCNSDDNKKYTIGHNMDINESAEIEEKEYKHFHQLNRISILRKGNLNKHFYSIEYLFLTETSDTIQLSNRNKDKNNFPLALSLTDLTNQLWITGNKGFGTGALPVTFDIRNQAVFALSAPYAKAVCKVYDSVLKNNKNCDRSVIIDNVAELRKFDLNPDSINQDNCEEIEKIITEGDFNKHFEEKSHHENESKRKTIIIRSKNKEIEALKLVNIKNTLKKKHEKQKINIRVKKIIKFICYISIIGVFIYHKKQIYKIIKHPLFAIILGAVGTIITIYSFFGAK